MNFRKKVVVAALAITMMSAQSLEIDFSFLNTYSISYADGAPNESTEVEKSKDTISNKTVYSDQEIAAMDNILEYLRDRFTDLYNNDEFITLKDDKANSEDIKAKYAIFDEAYNILKESGETGSDKKVLEVDDSEKKLKAILDLKIFELISEEFLDITDPIPVSNSVPLNDDSQNNSKEESLDDILKSIVNAKSDISKSGDNITIKNPDSYESYIKDKKDIKGKIDSLVSEIEGYKNNNYYSSVDKTIIDSAEKVLKEAKKISEEKNSSKNQFVEIKEILENTSKQIKQSLEILETRNEISNLLNNLKNLKNDSIYKALKEIDQDMDKNVDKVINDTEIILKNKKTPKDNLIKAKLDIQNKINEINNKIDIEKNKILLQKNIKDLEKKIEDNKEKLKEEDIKPIKDSIAKIKSDISNADKTKLDMHIKEIEQKNKQLDELIEKSKEPEKLKELKGIVDSSKEAKETQAYYRASQEKRKKYDDSLKNAEEYLSEIKNNKTTYKEDSVKELIKGLNDAKSELDGMSYDPMLAEAKKDFDSKKDYLSEKSIKELQEKLDALNDMKNKDNTVDDIKSFTDLLNQKFKDDSASNGDNSKNIKVKKVLVPKVDGKKGLKAKSIVRTGIDSIKLFGVVAVVAIVLLVITSKKKNK